MHFNTTSHRCTRNRSIPYRNIQQLYCHPAGWCQLVLLHQCLPDDVHNSEGGSRALHFKEIDAVLSGVALFSLVLAFKKQTMPKAINHLGKISFSFYMIHYYVILIVGRVIGLKVISVKSMCAIAIIMLSSVVLASIANYLIEDKFTCFLKKKLCRE